MLNFKFDHSPLKNILKNEIAPLVKGWDEGCQFHKDGVERLHREGFFSVFLPEEFGGRQAPTRELIEIAYQLAQTSAGLFTTYIGNLLSTTALYRFGFPEIASSVFQSYNSNRELMSFCMTEPETGTDVARLQTQARASQDGKTYVINGRKIFITNINHATHLIVFATETNSQGSPQGVSAFYVPRRAFGVKVTQAFEKLGHRDADTGAVEFVNVEISARYRLGKGGDGLDILASCISRTKTLIGAAAVGVSMRAFELCGDYLSKRILYGKPLLAKPEIRTVLAQAMTQVEATWLLTCHSADTWDQHGVAIKEASMAKYLGGRACVSFVSEAMELCGAHSYMSGSEMNKLYRDAKLFEIYEGASLVQLAIIGREVLKPFVVAAKPSRAAA